MRRASDRRIEPRPAFPTLRAFRSCQTVAFFVAVVGLWSGTPPRALAQQPTKPPAKSLSTRVAEQKQQIEALEKEIAAQRTQLTAQQAVADSQTARVRELEAELEVLSRRLAELERKAGEPGWESALEARLQEIEAASKKSPELPPDIVSAGDFPGSIRIPRTDAAVKFGGRIRTAAVLTLDPLGSDESSPSQDTLHVTWPRSSSASYNPVLFVYEPYNVIGTALAAFANKTPMANDALKIRARTLIP